MTEQLEKMTLKDLSDIDPAGGKVYEEINLLLDELKPFKTMGDFMTECESCGLNTGGLKEALSCLALTWRDADADRTGRY